MRVKKLVLALPVLTCAASVFGGAPVYAQSVPDGQTQLEVVEVKGIRQSLEDSIDTKRNMDSVADVISAEDVGQFPDTNVAESLSHMPGLAVDRQFGEGEKVSIHGTDPALNRVFIDGHAIASADWGGNPSDSSGRTFNYALLAPQIIGQAKVYKSPEAWIDEGSIGGTVMISTQKPLDLDPNTLSASAGYSYNDRSGKGSAQGSALYSWHNDSGTLGALLAVTYDKKRMARAGIEYFGYIYGSKLNVDSSTTLNGETQTADGLAEMQSSRMPDAINFAYFEQERRRLGFSGALQWKPTDDLLFTLTGLYIDGNYSNYSQSEYAVPYDGGTASNVNYSDDIVTGATVTGTGFTNFDSSNPNAETNYTYDAELDNNYRKTTVKIDSLNLAGEWHSGDWLLSGNVGMTHASGGKNPEYQGTFKYAGGYQFKFDQDHTYLNYDSDPTDPTTFFRDDLTYQEVNGEAGYYAQIGGIGYEIYKDRENYGQIDATRAFDKGVLTDIRFGLKMSNHENSDWSKSYNVYTDEYTDLSDYDYTLSPKGLFDGLGASGNATRFATLTKSGLIDMIKSGITEDEGLNYSSMFDVGELVQDFYAQGDYSFGQLHGNFGGRFARTRDKSIYYSYDEDSDSWSQESTIQDSVKFLPNINVVYDFTDQLSLKLGVAKVMARPRYGDLAGAYSVSNTEFTGSGGNPDLKPYESINYEASLEYYFSKTGMISGEFFTRDISSYVVSTTEDEQLYDTETKTMETYSVTKPINAQSAKVYGFAVSLDTDLIWGFGISTNATFAEAHVPGNDYYMPYLSRYTFNISPYYQHGPLQVRMNLNYRSKYFTSIGRLSSKDYTDEYTELDASAQYDFTNYLSFYVKAQNLLDETYYQFSSVKIAPTDFYKNGREVMAGFNLKL